MNFTQEASWTAGAKGEGLWLCPKWWVIQYFTLTTYRRRYDILFSQWCSAPQTCSTKNHMCNTLKTQTNNLPLYTAISAYPALTGMLPMSCLFHVIHLQKFVFIILGEAFFQTQVFFPFYFSSKTSTFTGLGAAKKKDVKSLCTWFILTFIKMNICKLFSPRAALYYAKFLTLGKVTDSVSN